MIASLPDAVRHALVADQIRVAKKTLLPFSERVRLHPHSGDLFRVETRFGEVYMFEVEFVSSPWVFYQKWNSRDPVKKNCKVQLGAWRSNLSGARIERTTP